MPEGLTAVRLPGTRVGPPRKIVVVIRVGESHKSIENSWNGCISPRESKAEAAVKPPVT